MLARSRETVACVTWKPCSASKATMSFWEVTWRSVRSDRMMRLRAEDVDMHESYAYAYTGANRREPRSLVLLCPASPSTGRPPHLGLHLGVSDPETAIPGVVVAHCYSSLCGDHVSIETEVEPAEPIGFPHTPIAAHGEQLVVHGGHGHPAKSADLAPASVGRGGVTGHIAGLRLDQRDHQLVTRHHLYDRLTGFEVGRVDLPPPIEIVGSIERRSSGDATAHIPIAVPPDRRLDHQTTGDGNRVPFLRVDGTQ